MPGTENHIFSINGEQEFNELAVELFHHQSQENQVYRDFLQLLEINTASIYHYKDIPFLPISFFKTHEVKTGEWQAAEIFTSSGTSSSKVSRHLVRDPAAYISSFTKAFNLFYGMPGDYAILALLPSYLEREGSSLVYMAEHLVRESLNPLSGFFLHNQDELIRHLRLLQAQKTPTILLGVTFALLELASKNKEIFPELILMETGGMKGRAVEITREEVHQLLEKSFGVASVHSEYGMTELMSQAYSKREGCFYSPPWMKILVRQVQDPLAPAAAGESGGINVIDLANRDSCAFIATEDLGKVYPDGSFEVLGRFDHSDVRGCNLLVL